MDTQMHLEVRDRNGERTDADGAIHFVDGATDAPIGVSVMTGDDLHPVSHYAYEAELLAGPKQLFVRVRQYNTQHGDRTTFFVSDDGGSTWRPCDRPASDARIIQTLVGKPDPNLFTAG
jgi:hypothetical protein